jgi:hypothetical protein
MSSPLDVAGDEGSIDSIAAKVADRQVSLPSSQRRRAPNNSSFSERDLETPRTTEVAPHDPQQLGFSFFGESTTSLASVSSSAFRDGSPQLSRSFDLETADNRSTSPKPTTTSGRCSTHDASEERAFALQLSCPICRSPSMSQTPSVCVGPQKDRNCREGVVFCRGCRELALCMRQGHCSPIPRPAR